jgi:hypothetical protein
MATSASGAFNTAKHTGDHEDDQVHNGLNKASENKEKHFDSDRDASSEDGGNDNDDNDDDDDDDDDDTSNDKSIVCLMCNEISSPKQLEYVDDVTHVSNTCVDIPWLKMNAENHCLGCSMLLDVYKHYKSVQEEEMELDTLWLRSYYHEGNRYVVDLDIGNCNITMGLSVAPGEKLHER